MDITEQNKNTVTSFIQALFTKGDLGAVDEYLAEDFVDHDPPMGGPANREGPSAAAVSWWPPCSPGRRGSPGRQAGRVSSITREGRLFRSLGARSRRRTR